MVAQTPRPARLAVLIDAENASARIADGLFGEIAKIGEASVRRIYGDFSGTRLKGWSDILSTHAILPHQNFAYTAGKNASDIALVIDAMDLLHSGRFDGFCLVSSDSDFTRLAARIREQGIDVYGFGEQKTPESFRQACRRFFFTENLLPEALPTEPGHAPANKPLQPPSAAGAAAVQSTCSDDQRRGMVRAWPGRSSPERAGARIRSTHVRLCKAFRPCRQNRHLRHRNTGRPRHPGSAQEKADPRSSDWVKPFKHSCHGPRLRATQVTSSLSQNKK